MAQLPIALTYVPLTNVPLPPANAVVVITLYGTRSRVWLSCSHRRMVKRRIDNLIEYLKSL
ncbi:MAG: hypothetical protein VB860_08355 [Dehalococcoidia bacterium]